MQNSKCKFQNFENLKAKTILHFSFCILHFALEKAQAVLLLQIEII